MKKTYIIPETLIADLFMRGNILILSVHDGSTTTLNSNTVHGEDADVKDSKNIWDDEW